jgi:uncharacterized protein (DUF39 family)
MTRTFEEINEKIKAGKAVVVTAEEMTGIVRKKGVARAAREVDVVTTGTFGTMCSSGAFFNCGHTTPRMKMQKVWMNNVPAYAGVAAVDFYLGATELPEDDPLNKVFPGEFRYGGGHVIEDLVRGREVTVRATAYGTDCYPRREFEGNLTLARFKNAYLMNPRNAYQNYNVATNRNAKRPIYTYLGVLRPGMANANYSSAGALSPLLNDPYYRTIGIGTRIFLGGAVGFVAFPGTQHDPDMGRTERGVPKGGAGTIAVMGDLKKMTPEYLRGVSVVGYGSSLAVGIGIPIPILDEDMAWFTGVGDDEILAPVIDYSTDYFANTGKILAYVSYAQLRSGEIKVEGRKVQTAALSSLLKAREIAAALKAWIAEGLFLLGKPVETLPGSERGARLKRRG